MNQELHPKAGRPRMPADYGVPAHNDTVLPWSYVDERLSAARNYWIATASPDGRPAATPVWGVWLGGRLYFEGSPETRRGRNIARNPHIAVHLESGDQVVILEGQAEVYRGAPPRSLAESLSAAFSAKYGPDYAPTPENWDRGGLYAFTPRVALGWTRFPEDLTRWEL